jgi:hypothetical protein
MQHVTSHVLSLLGSCASFQAPPDTDKRLWLNGDAHQVRLSSHGSFSCTLKLRYEYNASGQRKDSVEEFSFGEVVYDESAVEECIRRAQKAILNPSKSVDTFTE